jgi:hypothetical protein
VISHAWTREPEARSEERELRAPFSFRLLDPGSSVLAAGSILVLLLVAGCRSMPVVAPAGERPWRGPTESMAEVVEQINANNRLLPTLWARMFFEATIVDTERQREDYVNGDGLLLYRRPLDLMVLGRKAGLGNIFTIGSNGREYWLTLVPEMDTMWWGRYEHLGKPCTGEMPIRPDMVLEVLGVREIDEDFLRLPAPTMRFNPDADAYMFVWSAPAADRWIAWKEIWYDRATKLPVLVLLFDGDGRVVLRAYLEDHRQVMVPRMEQAQWPRMAHRFRLFFPENRSRMLLELAADPGDRVQLSERGAPRDATFAFPGRTRREAGVSQVIQIDEACDR